ncbi:MAG: hypothetical protein H6722_11235 [Sandaracinus sp.]|nr:hypothetical protein [Sandaracinus sp.]MCB9622259.1 hypothetical protein [Sandaracinus sp.]
MLARFAPAFLALLACSPSPRPASSDAGTTPPDAGPADSGRPTSEDAGAARDASNDASLPVPPDLCEVKLAATPRTECRDSCDARLLLVSGGYWCTFQCERDDECASQGLSCIAEMGGVCAPRCRSDDECPEGFYRCDPTGGFCDTYPVEP